MTRGSCAGQGGCGPVRPEGGAAPPGGGPPQNGPPGALYVEIKSVRIVAGQPEQSIFTLPPAAAVDVFIRFRNPLTGVVVDPSGASRFSIYATQKLVSYRVDRSAASNVTETNARILAVRDLPVDAFEVKVDGALLVDADGAFYDVVAIGWGREPTAIGPLPLTQWIDGAEIPEAGRNVGIPLMVVNADDISTPVSGTDTTVHAPGSTAQSDMNVLPVGQYLAAPPTRTNTQLGPLMTDDLGNLKITIASGSGTVFPAASALADNDPNPTTTRIGANLLLYDGTTWDRGRSGFITAATPTGWQNQLAGGVFNNAAPTLTDGQAITLQLDVSGNLKIREQAFPTAAALADDAANPTTTRIGASLLLYDGTTWDRARSGGIAAATPTGWQNQLAGGVFNSAPPSLTDGQAITLQVTSAGNLKSAEQFQPVYEDNTNGVAGVHNKPVVSSTYAWSVIFSTALAAKLIIKAAAGKIRHIEGRIDSTATTGTYYVQLWNLTDVPADTTAVGATNSRMAPFKIQHTSGTDDYFEFDFTDPGVHADTGLTLGLSTTEFTKTAAGSFLSATAEFI